MSFKGWGALLTVPRALEQRVDRHDERCDTVTNKRQRLMSSWDGAAVDLGDTGTRHLEGFPDEIPVESFTEDSQCIVDELMLVDFHVDLGFLVETAGITHLVVGTENRRV